MTSRADLPRAQRIAVARADGFNARFAIGAELVVHPNGHADPRTKRGRLQPPGAFVTADDQVRLRIDTVRGLLTTRDVASASYCGVMRNG